MLGITPTQYRVLEQYGFFLADYSTFDWTLLDRYSPDEFRQAFPEYYI